MANEDIGRYKIPEVNKNGFYAWFKRELPSRAMISSDLNEWAYITKVDELGRYHTRLAHFRDEAFFIMEIIDGTVMRFSTHHCMLESSYS